MWTRHRLAILERQMHVLEDQLLKTRQQINTMEMNIIRFEQRINERMDAVSARQYRSAREDCTEKVINAREKEKEVVIGGRTVPVHDLNDAIMDFRDRMSTPEKGLKAKEVLEEIEKSWVAANALKATFDTMNDDSLDAEIYRLKLFEQISPTGRKEENREPNQQTLNGINVAWSEPTDEQIQKLEEDFGKLHKGVREVPPVGFKAIKVMQEVERAWISESPVKHAECEPGEFTGLSESVHKGMTNPETEHVQMGAKSDLLCPDANEDTLLLNWLEEKHYMLSFEYPDEESDGVWVVTKESGNVNDRVWRKVGQGTTIREAIKSAMPIRQVDPPCASNSGGCERPLSCYSYLCQTQSGHKYCTGKVHDCDEPDCPSRRKEKSY